MKKNLKIIFIMFIIIMMFVNKSFADETNYYGKFQEIVDEFENMTEINKIDAIEFYNIFMTKYDQYVDQVTIEQKKNFYNYFNNNRGLLNSHFSGLDLDENGNMISLVTLAREIFFKLDDLQKRIEEEENNNPPDTNVPNEDEPYLPIIGNTWRTIYNDYKNYVNRERNGNFSDNTAKEYTEILLNHCDPHKIVELISDDDIDISQFGTEEARIYGFISEKLLGEQVFDDTTRKEEAGKVQENLNQIKTDIDLGDTELDLDEISNDITYNVNQGQERENEKAHKSAGNYTIPQKISAGSTADTIDDVIEDADNFVNISQDTGKFGGISLESIQAFSKRYYTILFEVGVIITVIVGAIIGIKFILASTEQKAEIKQLLLPYIAGCVIIYGAFGIWKIVVTLITNNL